MLMKKPTIPMGYKHLPGCRGYIHYDEETGQTYETDAMEDGTEVFRRWRPPEFSKCIEERIRNGKFGEVKTYRL
jgi:hypothetical protein